MTLLQGGRRRHSAVLGIAIALAVSVLLWAALIAAAWFLLALAALEAPALGARAWPRPPAWWLQSDFMRCVRAVESANGRTSSNVYGMLDGWRVAGGSGSAGAATRAEQDYRAWLLWRRYGTGAWRPWDGC